MKTLDELIEVYTHCLQLGEIQIAYKTIFEFLGKLRAEFIKKYPDNDVSSIYQGYMDMSYFSLSTKTLKEKGLKIAIVYLHEKGSFEVWLSARNRAITKGYSSKFKKCMECDSDLFHDDSNPDSIIECILTSEPSFDNQSLLIETIDKGVESLVKSIYKYL